MEIMAENDNTRKFLIIASILQIVWGLVPSASKFVIDEIPVELYVTLRWTISGAIFASYLLITGALPKVSLRDFFWISVLGILGYGMASFGTLYGLKIGGVTNFALMGSLSPVISSLTAIIVLKERPRKIFYVALPLVVLGLALLVMGKYQISSLAIAGSSAALILGAVFLEALVFIYSKRFKTGMSVIQYITIAQVSTAIFMWLLQGLYFRQISSLADLSLKGASAALFVSVVACVLCYVVLYWLLNHIEGHRLALFDGFHTLSAVIFGYLLFREELRPLMIGGGLLILCGLIAGNWPAHIAPGDPE
jgi:drug/metabolite transporter (DMT)-like permease